MPPYDKIRIWQVRFQQIRPMNSLPWPHEIVLEKQVSPRYHLEGRGRTKTYTQISCTLSGEGAFRHRDTIYKLTPGKAFMSCLGNPDTAYYYPGHAAEPWIFLWFDMQGDAAVRITDEMNARYGYVFDVPLDGSFIRYLHSFRNQRHSMRFVTPTEGAKIVHDALALLGETIEKGEVTSRASQLVRAAQLMIADHLDRSLDIADVAERLGVSREHLIRVFYAQTGTTPGSFASGERMKLALRLLRDRQLNCGQIAERTGFESAATFARAFKKAFGCSPVRYQKKI